MSEKCFCHLNGYKVKDSTAREQIVALSNRVDDVIENFESIINTLSERLNEANTNIVNLERVVADQNEVITQQGTQIVDQGVKITELETENDSLSNRLSNANTKISSLESKNESLSNAVGSLETTVVKHSSQIAEQNVKITEQGAKIVNLETKNADLETRLNSNNTKITNLESIVTQQGINIVNLTKRVTAIENDTTYEPDDDPTPSEYPKYYTATIVNTSDYAITIDDTVIPAGATRTINVEYELSATSGKTQRELKVEWCANGGEIQNDGRTMYEFTSEEIKTGVILYSDTIYTLIDYADETGGDDVTEIPLYCTIHNQTNDPIVVDGKTVDTGNNLKLLIGTRFVVDDYDSIRDDFTIKWGLVGGWIEDSSGAVQWEFTSEEEKGMIGFEPDETYYCKTVTEE